MSTTVHPHKRSGGRTEIVRVVKLNVTGVSIKVMAKSSTMLVRIGRVDSRMYPLVLNLVTQIVFGNLNGHK